ncbi:MAG: hypothetical protein KY437_10825 [Actinobacteria bacterium]|nr:hypothetical protein [Actinomycetota bacterium]
MVAVRLPSVRRVLTLVASLATVLALLPAVPAAAEDVCFPGVDINEEIYQLQARVFPDPHAYWPSSQGVPGESPWAKGMGACRPADFIAWDEAIHGLEFLAEDLFPDFVELYDLSDPDGRFAAILDLEAGEGMSAGLPSEDLSREKSPMYMLRVTDEQDTTIPIGDRDHFVFTLSIHGIERAGVEGGLRAAEDLATWAACEKHGDEDTLANCDLEEAGPDEPHPILETLPDESITAGDALKRTSVWFVLSNPDGWRRGDKQEGHFFYQRYNGNGMDLNRDWPVRGYTYRPYTPFSEPETRSVGKALKDVEDTWTGGIDLHGQLIDRAFSFTLLGGQQRPFGKDRRVLQFTKGAWEDAEQRLQWSSAIKPNDAPEDDPRMYGVQWGTIWDTIDYTVTGALGDWIDSPLGLNAEGIDNEMSMSHLSNCGVGTCWLPEFEQLHVDGNKSLIYAMIHYQLLPEDTGFRYEGQAAWLHNPRRLSHPGSEEPSPPDRFDLSPQEGFEETLFHNGSKTTHEFEVLGRDQGVFNGGLTATFTMGNAGGVSSGAFLELAIDQFRPEEEDPEPAGGDEGWQVANSYYNQSAIYLQAGARVDVNLPGPGQYRVRVQGGGYQGPVDVDVDFTEEKAWPDPGQLPYDVSNMDFLTDLRPFVPSRDDLVPVTVDEVLSGAVDLAAFDSVVAVDDAFLPGFTEPKSFRAEAQEAVEGTVIARGAGAGIRSDATSTFFEFDVEGGDAALEIHATWNAPGDYDLFVQKETPIGWSGDVSSGTSGSLSEEFARVGAPRSGRYRVEVNNWAGPSGQPIDLVVSFYNPDAEPGPGGEGASPSAEETIEVVTAVEDRPTKYDAEDRDRMAEATRRFVEQGGNLVLTDDSLRALEWMGLVPDRGVFEATVFAGHAQFSADGGETTTYEDPLAEGVDQPGAAEGQGHRHQISEPVPTGYAIGTGSGTARMETAPQWLVDRFAWEEAGGRVVGVMGGDVTLGELPVEDGVVRVLGSLVPFPTDDYDHPFGLSGYGVTYSGYEIFRNMLDWTNPNGTVARPQPQPAEEPAEEEPAPADLPATGGGPGLWTLIALAVAVLVAVRLRRRLGATSRRGRVVG